MITLSHKPNTLPPSSINPYGYLIDDNGTDTGTPIDIYTCADQHVFFDALIYTANGSTGPDFDNLANTIAPANNLPDNAINGLQLPVALFRIIQTYCRYLIGLFKADQATVNAGTDDINYVTSLKLTTFINSKFGAWIQDASITNWIASSTNPLRPSNASVWYKIVGKTLFCSFEASGTSTNGTQNQMQYTFPTSIRRSLQTATHSSATWITINSTGAVAQLAIVDNGTSLSIFINAQSAYTSGVSVASTGNFTINID